VKPGDGDDRARIQAAIDQVSSMSPDANGYRGAVLLTAGEYQVSSSLNLTTSGVVLRGVGESETDGTRILFTDTSGSVSNQTALIQIGGTGSTSGSGYTRTIVSPYVPAGSRSFDVDNVSTFAVGDEVMVYRPSTSAWITMLGMDRLEAGTQWQPGDRDLNLQRTIVRLEGNRVFLDAPIPTAIDATYGGGTIKKYTFAGRIEKCGVENLRGLSVYTSPTDESHGWICVKIGVAQNCWVRRVTARYFAGNAVAMLKGAKWVSVLNCVSLDPVSVITGERRYAFFMDDAEFCLVRDCSTANDRHQFVTGSNTSGPNAFVSGTSTNAWSDAGPHHRWASGILWDRIVVSDNELNLRNRGNLGTGHGWSGANSVAWNCQATALDVENPPTARNWLIGSVGTLTATNPAAVPPNPNFGTYDSNGANVFPLSLWGNQRQDLLVRSQVQVREYTVGDFDLFNPSGVTGDSVPRCPDDRIVKVRQDVCAGLARVRSPAERLGDDVTGVNAGGKQCGRDLGDGCLALGGGPFTTADHGCRGADADKTIGRKPFPHTPDQEGDIGPLPSPVGMQLIQDEKPEAGTVPNDLAVKVVLPGHQELEHHEVGQQDVGRVRSNAHPFLVTLLARVPLELDWAGNARPEVVEVLLELLKLAVRQGVHGVDDDRPGPPGGIVIAFTEDCIDDGNEEAERFA